MLSKISKNVYLPILDKYKKIPFSEVLAVAQRNQFLSTKDLRELQLTRLNRILAFAKLNSKYYEELLVNIHPPITSLEEFSTLPTLTKEQLVSNMGEIRTNRPNGREFVARTSGSTGIALQFATDSFQHAWAEAVQWRGRGWWNLSRGDRQVILWGRPLSDQRSFDLLASTKSRFRNVTHFNTFEDLDPRRLKQITSTLKRIQPKLIYGYGSSLGKLASFMEETGITLTNDQSPRLVEYTADHLLVQEMRTASRVFGAPIVSAYGASETPGIAQQCWAGNSHIAIDNVILEFVRPNGQPAEADEPAELLVTTLNNFSMPLIRYRVGDHGVLKEGLCRCGVNLPIMDLSIGKSVELIKTSARSAVSAHSLDYVNIRLMRQGIFGIKQFIVEQIGLDHFQLDYVRSEPFEQRSVLEFVAQMRDLLGNQISVDVREVPVIQTDASGKRRYFKSRLKENFDLNIDVPHE